MTYLGRKRRANQKERQLRSRRHKYEHNYVGMKPETIVMGFYSGFPVSQETAR